MSTTTQMSRADALAALARHGDSILNADFANEIARAFDRDVRAMGLIYNTQKGIDWGARATYESTGPAVNACTLAQVLCEELEVPLVKYRTDYLGAGKRSRALTAQAVISMDLHFNVRSHRNCDLCRSYDLDGNQSLCWGCSSLIERPYEANVHKVDGFGPSKPWWVRQLGSGDYISFATRKEAREFADLMRTAQEHLREIHG